MDRSPAGFLSYARLDDEYEEGYITQLRNRLEKEARLFTGEDFVIFQDRIDIRWGEEWAVRIVNTLNSVTFLFPILTPSFFKSRNCMQELQDFLDLEQKTGRHDFILPIYYIESLVLESAERRQDHPLAQAISTRQYVDWRDLRGASFRDPRTRTRLTTMARQIRDALDKSASRVALSEPKRYQVAPSSSSEERGRLETSPLEQDNSPSFYEDFVIHISRSSEGDYVLRVLRSPAGEGEAQIAEGYVLQEIEEVSQSVARMGDRNSSTQDVERLGQRIYRLLMPKPIETLFTQSLAYLGPKQGLRLSLRLGLADPTVAPFWSLPWEYIHLPDLGFLGLSRRCLIVHLWDRTLPSRPPIRVAPLRLLVVAVNHPSLAPLDLSREIGDIKQAFASASTQIEVLQDATLEMVRAALFQGDFHGIHFTGHGFFDNESGEGALLFMDRSGNIQAVTGGLFAEVLGGFSSLRFAVLNAFHSGKVASVNPGGGVAAALIRSGVSAVVALQTGITDAEAIAFSDSFYRRLAAGDPIDVAVVEGRLAIKLMNPKGISWGSPVLYMRVSDTRLFVPEPVE